MNRLDIYKKCKSSFWVRLLGELVVVIPGKEKDLWFKVYCWPRFFWVPKSWLSLALVNVLRKDYGACVETVSCGACVWVFKCKPIELR